MALLVAAAFSDVTSAIGWRRAWRAFALWWRALDKGERASAGLQAKRMEVCRECPIFYVPLGTCGTPLKEELRDQGCWCHMESKSAITSANCWLDETLGEDAPFGWKQSGL